MLPADLATTLRVDISNIGYRSHGTEWVYENVISPFSRMYYVTDGDAYVWHHDQEYHITQGTIHMVPCFTLSNYRCPGHFQMFYIHFTARLEGGMDLCNVGKFSYQIHANDWHDVLFTRLLELLPGRTIEVCRPHSMEDKREALRKLDGGCLSTDVYLESDGIFRQILSGFMRGLDEVELVPSVRFARVVEYIESHLDGPIRIETLARITNLHPNYFSDQFMQIYGVRPGEYILRRRVEYAQTLILANEYSLKEVAAEAGFSDAAHFSRTFKKYTGISPSRYLAQT